jgi:glycine/D-amino acid oxidase-like deaminating enzyme
MPNTENGKSKDHINGFLSMADFEGSYDVIVVGGGAAGIGAAIRAKQTMPQSRVLIVQSKACLGGAATHRGVLSCCGLYGVGPPDPRRAAGQIWTELHARLVSEGAATALPDRVVAYIQPRQTFYILELEASFGSSMPIPRSLSMSWMT